MLIDLEYEIQYYHTSLRVSGNSCTYGRFLANKRVHETYPLRNITSKL